MAHRYSGKSKECPFTLSQLHDAIRYFAGSHDDYGPHKGSGKTIIGRQAVKWSEVERYAQKHMIPGAEDKNSLNEIVLSIGIQPFPEKVAYGDNFEEKDIREAFLSHNKEKGRFPVRSTRTLMVGGMTTTGETVFKAFEQGRVNGTKCRTMPEYARLLLRGQTGLTTAPAAMPFGYKPFTDLGDMDAGAALRDVTKWLKTSGANRDNLRRLSTDLGKGILVGHFKEALRRGRFKNFELYTQISNPPRDLWNFLEQCEQAGTFSFEAAADAEPT